jgi:MFS family permease
MSPKVSAIAIGFFLGYVVAFVLYVTLGTVLAPSRGEEGAPHWMGLFSLGSVILVLGGPMLGGYVAAHIAKTQPLLHGFIVGVLGAIFAVVVTGALPAFGTAFIFVPGGIFGAWVWKLRHEKRAL